GIMVGPQEDDFEFKPLTAGLGFDQKTKGLRPNSGAARTPTSEESFVALGGGSAMGFSTNPQPAAPAKKDSSVAAQKVSQIISSLPSLDFLDSAPAPKKSSSPVVTQNALPRPANTTPAASFGDIPGLPKRERQAAAASVPPAATQGLKTSAAKPTAAAVANSAGPSAMNSAATFPKNIAALPSTQAVLPTKVPSPKTLVSAATSAMAALTGTTTIRTPEKATTAEAARTVLNDVPTAEPLLIETPFHMGAAIFDALVVVGLTCLFAVALLLITGTDLNIILTNARTDLATQLGIGLLVLSVFALYSIIGRAFCGMTLGEWTFDLQVGSEGEQMRAWYPLAITLRWILLVATGLVVFPLLSAIFGKDLLGRATGVKLYQLGQASR
ncbi:MAG: hypothetical protein K2X47_11345, partial [Bdellovibrionales bacterium]|nr:hypothetical protein [Bdellovibrionales bacterium]